LLESTVEEVTLRAFNDPRSFTGKKSALSRSPLAHEITVARCF
jgi:hypothetical protein